ncbi:hypothetical protein DSCO28_28200 [Desulfosarcina ovata subsp. sediminis]|uniref:Uncharacterized protein n=1 Tax=Desulfosarcina ovata subsp. sediminis TaxID=885957 RepID=A0A5K7ZLG1_9BACT|nr:hypothetical protein DSCO28_28200 [Desulfosarcina ovata subsp. sediminis]
MVPDNPQPMPDMVPEAAGITDITGGNLPGVLEADASPARATSVAAMAGEVFAAPLPPSADRPYPQAQAAETPPPSRDEPAVTAAASRAPHAAGEPAVHIGLVEVVVLAPQDSGTGRSTTFKQGNDFASRNYLRNL